ASDSAGDLLLVALKMPPSRIGTYSNFTPVRFSIAGIASWLRKALGLPKSNRNCGLVLTAVSLDVLTHCGARLTVRPQYYDERNIVERTICLWLSPAAAAGGAASQHCK